MKTEKNMPLNTDPSRSDEQVPRRGLDRRSFLKAAGFTIAGTALAGCERRPVEKAIPFLVKPEEVTPGNATWYASTCGGCGAGCGILVKCRDGRPVKIEGNPSHPLSKGGLCATGQAMVLSLYDSLSLREPRIAGKQASWDEVDRLVAAKLSGARNAGEGIGIVTGSGAGPATLAAVRTFSASFGGVRHIVHEPLSAAALADAYGRCYGERFVPHYRFDRASVIVSFDADFLGTWISPVEFTAAYRAGRAPDGPSPVMSHHVHFESRMSLTGSNADRRIAVRPGEIPGLLEELARLVAAGAGAPQETPAAATPSGAQTLSGASPTGRAGAALPPLARLLAAAGPRGLVVCGVNDIRCQLTAALINRMLGNAGVTVELDRPAASRAEDDVAMQALIADMEEGGVGVLIVHGANPVYDHPLGARFAAAMKRTGLAAVFARHDNETSAAAGVVLPEGHPLAEWGDAEPVAGVVSVRQPVIEPFGNPRSLIECLFAWRGTKTAARDAIRDAWKESVFPRIAGGSDFETFWNRTVYDGFAEVRPARAATGAFDPSAIPESRGPAGTAPGDGVTGTPGGGEDTGRYTLELYPTVGLLDGRHAHNPWLQELPDPVTKAVWDNYASISKGTAERLGVRDGEMIRIDAGGIAVELPALIQPGQCDAVVSAALGYGRRGTERFTGVGPEWLEAVPTVEPGETVGRNVAPLAAVRDGYLSYSRDGVRVSVTGGKRVIATTQIHHSLRVPEHLASGHDERRPIVQETSLAAYLRSPEAGRFETGEKVSMWPEEYRFPRHRWAMAIDLTACTGCSACVIGCQAENNTPVVGKDEVFRNREMTWLRIDRYYTEGEGDVSVAHQPMMCQHCEHAPCETVCPVLATVHSEEGLNQQVYNRCVGTRYCSNNCPYKVRRFNWFDYPRGGEMERLVLNPDVVVRERGVMEKCSFCVQRIQEGKIRAKEEGRPLKDGEIRPACEQSCPASAIVFGDLDDPASRISQIRKNPRHYRVLEDTGVGPSVGYMTLVRNTAEGGEGNG